MSPPIIDQESEDAIKASGLPISIEAIDEIIGDEDTSESYYNGHYRKPEWPGGDSGVTIMLGYDLGYTEGTKLENDLKGKIPDEMLSWLHTAITLATRRLRFRLARSQHRPLRH